MDKTEFFQLFNAITRTVHQVVLPDTSCVFVRELSAHERSQYELTMADKDNDGMSSFRERLVVLCACDEAGKRIFEDSDTTMVGQMLSSIINPIFEKARKINGMTDVKPAEDIRKNSAAPNVS